MSVVARRSTITTSRSELRAAWGLLVLSALLSSIVPGFLSPLPPVDTSIGLAGSDCQLGLNLRRMSRDALSSLSALVLALACWHADGRRTDATLAPNVQILFAARRRLRSEGCVERLPTSAGGVQSEGWPP